MKKIFGSVLVIAVVASLGYLGTQAYFSDTEVSEDNFIQAGTIDIAVDDQNPWESSASWIVDDMKPSTTHYMSFTITNVGNNEADVWKRLTNLEYDGGVHPESEFGEDPNDEINNIGTVIHYDMYVDHEPLIIEADGYFVDSGIGDGQGNGVAGYWMYLGRLAPQGSMLVEQSYHMDSQTGNWAQGDNMTFDVELYAQQILGGATPPDGELPGYGRDDQDQGVLDEFDVGDPASEAGHALALWSDVWTWGGGYGGGDDGTLRLLMGPGDGCGSGFESATFTMEAGTEYAAQLRLRHLDGSQDDSFDVFVNGVKIGHYDHSGNPGENWVTSTFNLSSAVTGTVNVELVATMPANGWCASWGQVAFSYAELLR